MKSWFSGKSGVPPGLTALVAGLLACAAGAADEAPTVRGSVSDEAGRPVANARVLLRQMDTDAAHATRTDKQGHFALSNDFRGNCALEVCPSMKSGLSRAVIGEVPGNTTRQFVVHLQHGFRLSGRVTFAGRGVKGMTLQVVPSDAGSADAVHGGGWTATGSDGRFHLVLTPGPKTLVVVNERYSGLVKELRQPINVTGDTQLPDIVLPRIAQ
jgi:hypothetical protein